MSRLGSQPPQYQSPKYTPKYTDPDAITPGYVLKWVAACIAAIALVVFVLFTILAGISTFNRYQARQNASNSVNVTRILIHRAAQQARINYAQISATRAEADKRVVQAHGIAQAQAIINGSLTQNYLQWEAIQAQLAVATSGKNNTVIYVPSGVDGVPVQQVQQVPTNGGK